MVKATLECLGSQLWDEQHCSQSAPSSSAGAQSSCRPGPAPLGLAGCSQEAETEGRDALEQLGAEEPGSCREMGPCTPSSALPPMQRSGVWGGHCHRDGFCPSRGRIRKSSELTRGHPQEQQRRIVLQGSHGGTSQDRSIPNADETPRIKAPLEAASFCSQEQPASGWEAAGPRGSPHKQGTDGRDWVRDGNGAGGSSGTAQSPEARQHRAAGGARGACLGTGEAVWDPLFHC